MAMAWNQATTRPSGGLSMREARRAGRMHREEEGKSRPGVPGRTCPIIESVATLAKRPTDGELGRPESPQGAEFKQGPVSASRPCELVRERTAEPSSRWDRSSKTTRDISNRTCSDENVPQNQSRRCAIPMRRIQSHREAKRRGAPPRARAPVDIQDSSFSESPVSRREAFVAGGRKSHDTYVRERNGQCQDTGGYQQGHVIMLPGVFCPTPRKLYQGKDQLILYG